MISDCASMDMVNSIFQHPDIWPVISPPNTALFDVSYEDGHIYHLVNDGDGIIFYHEFRDGMKIHPNILPNKRGKLAYEAVEESIQKVFELGYRSIYCEIAVELKHIIRFARALDFNWIESNDRELFIRCKLDG